MAGKKKLSDSDWAKIEAEYRTGLYSDRQLAARHGVTNVYISKRAKECGWSRDLQSHIDLKREQKLAKQAAIERHVTANSENMSEAVADAQVVIINKHRETASKFQNVLCKMLKELDWTGDHVTLLEGALPKLADEDNPFDRLKLREAFNRLSTLSARSTSFHKLTVALSSLIDIERRSYGIEDKKKLDERSYEERLKELINASC